MMSFQSNYLPDVIQVVDFILLQDTPPHFYHPLHYKQANHINMVIRNDSEQVHMDGISGKPLVFNEGLENKKCSRTYSCNDSQVEKEFRCITDVKIGILTYKYCYKLKYCIQNLILKVFVNTKKYTFSTKSEVLIMHNGPCQNNT